MKRAPSLSNINSYLKKLIAHLRKAAESDPKRIIIDSLLGTRKVDLREVKPKSFGKHTLECYTGELKYSREINTLKKYGIVIDHGEGQLSIDPRFRKVLKSRKYQRVGQLNVQKRTELDKQLKGMGVNGYLVTAVLDSIDYQDTLKHLWDRLPKRILDNSYPHTYSTFCRMVRQYQRELSI